MAKKKKVVLYADTGMTTIPLMKTTRDRLKHFDIKGTTYDSILMSLMDYREEHPK
jgi:hypothetical protein